MASCAVSEPVSDVVRHDTASKSGFGAPMSLSNDFALNWLERDPSPRLVVTADLFIHWLNDAACHFLNETPGIARTDNTLCFDSIVDRHQCEMLVRSIEHSASLYLTSSQNDFLLIRAERLPDDPAGSLVALTLNSRHWTAQATRLDAIEAAFHLTRRELEIVRLLTQGMNAACIGTQVGCALETVRRHVKNIYLKVDVSNREELLNKLFVLF